MSKAKVTDASSSSNHNYDYFQFLPQVQTPQFYLNEKGARRKRRRCINPSFMPEIRILRRDIRRRFGEMIANVVNSHDISLLRQFCNDMFRPDCQIIRLNPPPNLVSRVIAELVYEEVSRYSNFSGFHSLVDEYTFHYEMIPDFVFLLQESHLRLKQGFGGSVVTMKFSSRGTQTFRIESNKINCVPIVPSIYTTFESIFTLILDEDNRIQYLHIEAFPVSEKLVGTE